MRRDRAGHAGAVLMRGGAVTGGIEARRDRAGEIGSAGSMPESITATSTRLPVASRCASIRPSFSGAY
jgi:hypothetical protein